MDQPSLDDELCEAYTEATGHIHLADKFINDLQLSEISKENIRCGWPDSLQEVAIDALPKPFWSTLHQLYLVTPTPGCSPRGEWSYCHPIKSPEEDTPDAS